MSGVWHWGIRCYFSTDLVNWDDRGLIIPPTPDDDIDSPLHPTKLLDRPHIIKHAETGKYVCWVKIMGEGLNQRTTVLAADHLLGPYEIVTTGLKPLGMNAGDFALVVDPTDGKAYYFEDRWLPAPEESNQTDRYRRLFSGEDPQTEKADESVQHQSDLRVAEYVWLPISFDGDVPRIDWRDAWSPEEFD